MIQSSILFGKRQLLIVDDEMVNREILGNLFAQEYDCVFAVDGNQAIEQMNRYKETLSLVLLDLIMPQMNGLDVLESVKNDPQLKQIPVIVITSDSQSEVESLRRGAADFIPKPYPQPDVIMARVRRSIELSEDRMIINATERDPLTELYNREFFYRYAEQFDIHHKEVQTDAIVLDIYHFHTINERFGTKYGDDVLRLMARKLREIVAPSGGIVCHREADAFMVYCPHGLDYVEMLAEVSNAINNYVGAHNRIRLRIGVYDTVDRNLPIERRFDRASEACDTVKSGYSGNIGFFDSAMHEKELYAEQLIEDFPRAIEKKEFVVYYQPKYNVQGETPVLVSAEALVRWNHPTRGCIAPSEFVELFEENGLIRKLDNYIWNEAAAQIKAWKERFGVSIPVSVNVSRADMFDPMIVDTFKTILKKNGISSQQMLLEITESAYTRNAEQIIKSVNTLREIGFRIEMDDFGTGYSSLNMISALPIDVLKVDMMFIQQAFSGKQDTKLIEIIFDIAKYLGVPVIAEGVETREQMEALKAMGCDIIQGYYFSKPLSAAEFETVLEENRHVDN